MDLGHSWGIQLSEELKKSYFLNLQQFLSTEIGEVYPPNELIFNAFIQTPFEQVKVVIVGQDPYHGKGQAEGLCFSVAPGVPIPPSLRNIFFELQQDLRIPPPSNGSLLPWAKQGVFLLNATLTVRAGEPHSHYGKGWEPFTDAVIEKLIQREDPVIFVLWGKSAQEKFKNHQQVQQRVLTAAHPSPFSAYRGFFGCRHFSQINSILKKWGKEPIDWVLP